MKYELLRLEHVNILKETILEDVKLTVYRGELLGIVGQNQSGKTVLAKLLSGLCEPDSGKVFLEGKEIRCDYFETLTKHKIMYINYHSKLITSMSISENICLLAFIRKYGITNSKKAQREKAEKVCEKWGIDLDFDASATSLCKADIHLALLARAIASDVRMVILDCITAGYTKGQYEILLKLIDKMVAAGITVVYVQQGVDRILLHTDRTVVLKAGRIVRILFRDELSELNIIKLLSGSMMQKAKRPDTKTDEEICRFEMLQILPFVRGITASLHLGEVLGLAVQEEHARTAIAEALFGLQPVQGGKMFVCGENRKFSDVSDAIKSGFALIPEGAYQQALFPTMKLYENINFYTPLLMGRKYGVIHKNVQDYISECCFLDMKEVDKEMLPTKLSHLQSFFLAVQKFRILKPKVYIIVHPTLGIDMWAHRAVYEKIYELLKEGASVILISPDADELINLCDTIMFFDKSGESRGILKAEEIVGEQSKHQIIMNLLEK